MPPIARGDGLAVGRDLPRVRVSSLDRSGWPRPWELAPRGHARLRSSRRWPLSSFLDRHYGPKIFVLQLSSTLFCRGFSFFTTSFLGFGFDVALFDIAGFAVSGAARGGFTATADEGTGSSAGLAVELKPCDAGAISGAAGEG